MKNHALIYVLVFFVFCFSVLAAPTCYLLDLDGDGIENQRDNCPYDSNPDQEDDDSDGVGDACDTCREAANIGDEDGDLIDDVCDNCLGISNPDQNDMDLDELGDACDPDLDGDGFLNEEDNCPEVENEDQNDQEDDGFGDSCDNCPDIYNPDQDDPDRDNVGQVCDSCPNDPNIGWDDDLDGIDNACDLCDDADGDEVCEEDDNCRYYNPDQADCDGDDQGDVCEYDGDDDGIPLDCDNCPDIPNPGQEDTDGDGTGDACEMPENCRQESILCVPQEFSSIQAAVDASPAFGVIVITDTGVPYDGCVRIFEKQTLTLQGQGNPEAVPFISNGHDGCNTFEIVNSTEINFETLRVENRSDIAAFNFRNSTGILWDISVEQAAPAIVTYGTSNISVNESEFRAELGIFATDTSRVYLLRSEITAWYASVLANADAIVQIASSILNGAVTVMDRVRLNLFNVDITTDLAFGVNVYEGPSVQIESSTIEAGVSALYADSQIFIEHSILLGDRSPLGGEVLPTFTNTTLLWGGECGGACESPNVIWADPQFAVGHIPENTSPAVDVAMYGPSEDVRGVPRPRDGNGNGVFLYDLGAYEVRTEE